MKGKVYIYPIISFLISLLITTQKGVYPGFELYMLIAMAILSPIIAIIGLIQLVKNWIYHNKILNFLLLSLNILLIVSGVFWVLFYLTIGTLGAPPKNRDISDSIIVKFVNFYKKIIPPFIK